MEGEGCRVSLNHIINSDRKWKNLYFSDILLYILLYYCASLISYHSFIQQISIEHAQNEADKDPCPCRAYSLVGEKMVNRVNK